MATGGRSLPMTTGVDTEEMLLIHRVIRRELGLAPALVRNAAGRRRFVVLGHILEEATPPERARFMEKVPPPARLVCRLFGRRQYEREAAGIRSLAS
jgi:hypothetical protein